MRGYNVRDNTLIHTEFSQMNLLEYNLYDAYKFLLEIREL